MHSESSAQSPGLAPARVVRMMRDFRGGRLPFKAVARRTHSLCHASTQTSLRSGEAACTVTVY
jgi:hypothetical protein